MSRPAEIPEALQPELDEHVDVAVSLGRGELRDAQEREVRARMVRDAAYRAVVEPIALAYEEPSLSQKDAGKTWPEFVRAAGMPESVAHAAVGTPGERGRVGRRRMVSMLAGSIAAVLFVVAGLGAWDYVTAARYDTITTGPAQTISVYLPDLTEATIGPSSDLKFPKQMWQNGDPERVVWLKGTVSLEVSAPGIKTPSGGRALGPFRIETGHARVTVLAVTWVKVEALPAATSVTVLTGMARAWPRIPGQPEPTGPGIELRAPFVARFTELGMQMLTR